MVAKSSPSAAIIQRLAADFLWRNRQSEMGIVNRNSSNLEPLYVGHQGLIDRNPVPATMNAPMACGAYSGNVLRVVRSSIGDTTHMVRFEIWTSVCSRERRGLLA